MYIRMCGFCFSFLLNSSATVGIDVGLEIKHVARLDVVCVGCDLVAEHKWHDLALDIGGQQYRIVDQVHSPANEPRRFRK